MKKSLFFPLAKRWDFLLVFLFLLGRLILNLELKTLSMIFVASYVVLLILMFTTKKVFWITAIVFLFVDSLIGTYLFTSSSNIGFEYFWTMGWNLLIVLVLLFDVKGNFIDK